MPERELFRTPHGKAIRLECREGTNDAMMARSSLDEDEYRLGDIPAGTLTTAVDVGAHIGMVAIGLALDHPDCMVQAVEPIPANVDILKANIARNGVEDRVRVVWGAASRNAQQVDVAWAFEGGDAADMHRFVGNQPMAPGTRQKTVTVPGITLNGLITPTGIDLLVIDCEGGEYELFAGKTAVAMKTKRLVREIRGEYHGGFTRLEALLESHEVVPIGGASTFGGFIARVRA
jgi:FkbM family methyltransferase